MKFTVYRNSWKNSHHGKGQSKLLNKEGYKCCLGFCLEQLGVPKHQLLNTSSPEALLKFNKTFDLNHIFTRTHMIGVFSSGNNVMSCKAIRINDNEVWNLEEKEKMLTYLFKECGHELEFVGDYEVDT